MDRADDGCGSETDGVASDALTVETAVRLGTALAQESVALVLDYLELDLVDAVIGSSADRFGGVAGCIQVLNVTRAVQMNDVNGAELAGRYHNVSEVSVSCLLTLEGITTVGLDEDDDSMNWNRPERFLCSISPEVAKLSPPFLHRFPKLVTASFRVSDEVTQWMDRVRPTSAASIHDAIEIDDSNNGRIALHSILLSFAACLDEGLFPSTFKSLKGFTGFHLGSSAYCNRNVWRIPNPARRCELCTGICNHFSFFDSFIGFDNPQADTGRSYIHGGNCLSVAEVYRIVRGRPGGEAYLRPIQDDIVRECIYQTSFEAILDEGWELYFDDANVPQTVRDIVDFRGIDALIDAGLQPSEITRRAFTGKNLLTFEENLWVRSSLQGLVDRGFDIDLDNAFVVDDDAPGLQEKKANMINGTINNDKVSMDKLNPEDLQFLFRGN